MVERTLAGSLGLKGGWAPGEDGWDSGMGDNLLWISVLVQGSVLDLVDAEPGAPVEGDTYILSAAHATHPNEIAAYDGGAWHYRTPENGWRLLNLALGSLVRFDGSAWSVDSSEVVVGGDGTIPDGVVSGCAVVYTGTALTFALTAGSFYLNETLHQAAAQTVTLDAADATNPRIDTLYVSDDGTFGKITGTPDADPVEPDIDPETQLFLLSVTVPAAAVDLSGSITDQLIYDEGSEWPATLVGAHIDAASVNNPYSGTTCIEASAAVTGDAVRLIAAAPSPFGYDGNLLLRIRSKAPWGTSGIELSWFFGGRRAGRQTSRVMLRDGAFGFNSSIVDGYQLISIPKYRFGLDPSEPVDELRVRAISAGGVGFYLDNIILQTPAPGATIINVTQGLTQEAADGRYLRQGENLGDLSDVAEARDNLDVYSKAAVDSAIGDIDVSAGSTPSQNWWRGHVPLAADFPTLFHGAATGNVDLTLADDGDVGLIVDSGVLLAGSNHRYALSSAIPSHAADWTVTARITPQLWPASETSIGIAIRNAASGAALVAGPQSVSGAYNINFRRQGNTTFGSNASTPTIQSGAALWIRIRYVLASDTYFADYSFTGKTWQQYASYTRATGFGAAYPDQVGIGMLINSATAAPAKSMGVIDYWRAA